MISIYFRVAKLTRLPTNIIAGGEHLQVKLYVVQKYHTSSYISCSKETFVLMKQLIFSRLSTTRSVVIITLIMTRSPGSNFLSLNVAIKILINCLNAGCAGKFIRKSSISALDSFSIKKLLYKVPQNAPLLYLYYYYVQSGRVRKGLL